MHVSYFGETVVVVVMYVCLFVCFVLFSLVLPYDTNGKQNRNNELLEAICLCFGPLRQVGRQSSCLNTTHRRAATNQAAVV